MHFLHDLPLLWTYLPLPSTSELKMMWMTRMSRTIQMIGITFKFYGWHKWYSAVVVHFSATLKMIQMQEMMPADYSWKYLGPWYWFNMGAILIDCVDPLWMTMIQVLWVPGLTLNMHCKQFMGENLAPSGLAVMALLKENLCPSSCLLPKTAAT